MTPDQLLNMFDNNIGLLLIVMAWVLAWKGWAMWRAARTGDKVWFIIFLLVNTVGVVEMIYLFLINPAKKAKV